MQYLTRRFVSFRQPAQFLRIHNVRSFQASALQLQLQQERSDPKAHRNFWKSHGRAVLKALTLAFFSYQVFYWAWISIETEQMKDQKGYEIKALQSEVKLLEEGRKGHRPLKQLDDGPSDGKRILEENKKP